MTYAKRKDLNQSDMEAELRQIGFHVCDTSRLGAGFPDMVVTGHHRYVGYTMALLVEVKQGRGTLTADELTFEEGYPLDGPYIIARTTEDVLRWFGAN